MRIDRVSPSDTQARRSLSTFDGIACYCTKMQIEQ